METAELVGIIVKLGVGALATFFAIVLWSMTRDSAWLFIIMGVILRYGGIMYDTFQLFGILTNETLVLGLPLVTLLLTNLPYVFFTVAFIIMIARSRIR